LQPCIRKLSERGVYAASLSLLPQLSLNSNLVRTFTLKRPDRRRAEAALFRLRLRLRRDRVVAKRRRRRAAKAEGRAPTNRQLRDAPLSCHSLDAAEHDIRAGERFCLKSNRPEPANP